MRSIAGEEESDMVVGRKVYQVGLAAIVGLAAVVLEFRQDLKFVGFVRKLFSLFQNFFLYIFHLKILYINLFVVLAIET